MVTAAYPEFSVNNPLLLTTFMKRPVAMYPDETGVVYRNPLTGEYFRFTWLEWYERTCRLANALQGPLGVKPGTAGQFMERFVSFTLCAFDPEHAGALELLGTRSGRDGDKIAQAGLTPVAAQRIAAPGFAEAVLTIECRKLYWDDLDPSKFLDPTIEAHYPQKDYHRIYFGEILRVAGSRDYRSKESS